MRCQIGWCRSVLRYTPASYMASQDPWVFVSVPARYPIPYHKTCLDPFPFGSCRITVPGTIFLRVLPYPNARNNFSSGLTCHVIVLFVFLFHFTFITWFKSLISISQFPYQQQISNFRYKSWKWKFQFKQSKKLSHSKHKRNVNSNHIRPHKDKSSEIINSSYLNV